MNFGRFYQVWLQHLHLLLSQLTSAPPAPDPSHRILSHYDDYYRVKAHFARTDVFAALDAAWLTSLERSLHWVGGWRPTTVFHLIFTVSSMRLETRLSGLITSNSDDVANLALLGESTGDLGDISAPQLGRINQLQCETVARENQISRELGAWQDGASNVVSLLRDEEPGSEVLVAVLNQADELRMRAFKGVVEILTAEQRREFLIAAAELQFGVRAWGLDKDQRRGGGS